MTNLRSWIGVVLIFFNIFSLTGCTGGEKTSVVGDGQVLSEMDYEASKTEGTVRVIDFAGREVELKQEAKKIVDLTQLEGIRTLIQLGEQDRLVGMSDYGHLAFDPNGNLKDMYSIDRKVAPEIKDIANVGTLNEPNVEMIMSLKPDIIFVNANGKYFADTLQKQTNIPVACIGVYGDFNFELFNIVGKLVGKEGKAKELLSFAKNRIKIVSDITSTIPEEEKKRVFFLISPHINDDPMTSARYDAIELAGGINVGSNGDIVGAYKTTKEQIVAWNPDFILINTFCMDKEQNKWHKVETIQQDAILKATKAVKNNNVYTAKGPMRGWDIATEITEVFYIAKLLYPDKFTDLDVEKHGNEILKEFYGIDGLFTDMSKKLRLHEWK